MMPEHAYTYTGQGQCELGVGARRVLLSLARTLAVVSDARRGSHLMIYLACVYDWCKRSSLQSAHDCSAEGVEVPTPF